MLKRTIVLLIFLTLSVIGCSTTKVYVLQKEEVIRVKTGQNVTIEYDGWVLSDRAVDRIMNAKIEGVRLK